MVALNDKISLDEAPTVRDEYKPRITRDGYLTATPRIARTGIQEYSAAEVGLTDRNPTDRIRVYRSEDEVFDAAALASMAHRPVTDGHPSVAVTSDNWREYARGDTGDEIIRDGQFIRVPIKLMDAALINDVKNGKRELSVGYTCDLEIIDGTTPDGHKYDAVQRNIRANHLAVCQTARGGPQLAIVDERRETHEPLNGERPMAEVKMTFDGVPFSVSDSTAEAVVNKIMQARDAAVAKNVTDASTITALTTERDTLQGEKVALEARLKDAEDPAKLQAAAVKRAALVADAKKIAPALVCDGKSDAEIRKLAVAHKLGDAVASMNDDQIAGAFRMAIPTSDAKSDDLRTAIKDGVIQTGDAKADYQAARTKRLAEMRGETVN
jgi:hypothetical protein